MSWTVAFSGQRVEGDALALPAGVVARFLGCAERMETFGPDPGMRHTRAMGGGLSERRLQATEGIARVFCCTVVDRRTILLHQFVKKTTKTPPNELQIGRRRMKEASHDKQARPVQGTRIRPPRRQERVPRPRG